MESLVGLDSFVEFCDAGHDDVEEFLVIVIESEPLKLFFDSSDICVFGSESYAILSFVHIVQQAINLFSHQRQCVYMKVVLVIKICKFVARIADKRIHFTFEPHDCGVVFELHLDVKLKLFNPLYHLRLSHVFLLLIVYCAHSFVLEVHV